MFENSGDSDEMIQNRVNEAKRIYRALAHGGAGGGGDIVENAESQLGSMYYWAAEGETINGYTCFDCSGFVKWCYDQAGKEGLDHYTVSIMNQATPISYDELEPGDIVGWGRQPELVLPRRNLRRRRQGDRRLRADRLDHGAVLL